MLYHSNDYCQSRMTRKMNLRGGIMLLVFAYLCVLNSVNCGITNNLVENVQTFDCDDILHTIPRRNLRAPNPLREKDIIGTWVSQSCETRPGAIHVLRSYEFYTGGHVNLSLHVYDDASCRIPAFSIYAHGRLALSRGSLVTPGATESEYLIKEINVIPHSNQAALELIETLNSTYCSTSILKALKPHRRTTVHKTFIPLNDVTSFGSTNCVPSLAKSWNELQLLRMEVGGLEENEADLTNEKDCERKELFLGDLHTDPSKQKEYRPTAFQHPLLSSECIKDCHVCQRILEAPPLAPPIEPYRALIHVPKVIEGHWASTRCEVQRYGLFLTRKISFNARQRWYISQRYFYDPACQNATYTISASGSYKKMTSRMHLLPVSFQGEAFDMTLRKMSITPEDKIFAGQLNHLPGRICGIQGRWRKGKAQDVTITGGCAPIGLKVPSLEPEILRLESGNNGKIYLSLGQTPTWPHREKGPAPRPTSWGPKLLKCTNVPESNNILRPIVGAQVALNKGSNGNGNGNGSSAAKCLIIFLSLSVFFNF